MQKANENKPQPLDSAAKKEQIRLQAIFGKRVRDIRLGQKMTIEKLAEYSDLSTNYVGDMERGDRNVSLFNLWRLAGGLGVKLSELMDDLPARKVKRQSSKNSVAR